MSYWRENVHLDLPGLLECVPHRALGILEHKLLVRRRAFGRGLKRLFTTLRKTLVRASFFRSASTQTWASVRVTWVISQTNIRDFAPIEHLVLVCRTLVLFFILVRDGTRGCFEVRVHFGQSQASFTLSQTSSRVDCIITPYIAHVKNARVKTSPSRREETSFLFYFGILLSLVQPKRTTQLYQQRETERGEPVSAGEMI